MRTHGTLTKWNDDRGFGFIRPAAQGARELFVHVSAFPASGGRPRIGELISFETEAGPDGRQRAIAVMRPGQRTVARPAAARASRNSGGGRGLARAIGIVMVAGLGLYGWSAYRDRIGMEGAPEESAPFAPASPTAGYACDGRTHCSEMSSCGEAEYFIRNCPNTQMDGDADGVPCESQWCN